MKNSNHKNTVGRDELLYFLNQYLEINEFQDYSPNGMQIEGREAISKIAFAVSATRESIHKAVANQADCLIVHHGIFWNYQGAKPVVGPFAQRLKPLVQNDVNLFAYHLPLDAHLITGNAAVLAQKLGLVAIENFGDYKGKPLGVKAKFAKPVKASVFQKILKELLERDVWLSSPNPEAPLNSIGIITGGANSEWKLAVKDKLDAYLTGEMSEYDWHDAQEAGVHMYAGGHHATEKFGIQSLMGKIQSTYPVECFFIDSNNPA